MTKNEMRRVPGFTAENALEQGASTPYAGLALAGAGGGAVEPASIRPGDAVLLFGPHCYRYCDGDQCTWYCTYRPLVAHL